MNAQFVIEHGVPIPDSPPTRSQGANRRALEETMRLMRVGDSFLVASPHLTGEARCVAANLGGLIIKIKPEGKVWRCWLLSDPVPEGTPPPKPLPPEQTTPPNPARPEGEIIAYLEKQRLQPEYAQNNKIRFRHPAKLSRVLTLDPGKNGEVRLSFSHALPEFEERWSLSPRGELPLNFEIDVVFEALDDFFEIEFPEPPVGSPAFEERLAEVESHIKQRANNRKYKRLNHYELNPDELMAIARAKTHEVYLKFGDKPTYEFQSIVIRSVERKFNSLLSKHYESKCRGPVEMEGPDGPERVERTMALTDEMSERLASMKPEETTTPTDEVDACLESLPPVERLLVKSIVRPTASEQIDRALDELRYQRVKNQKPNSRLLPPKKITLRKLALSTSKSENELKIALANLIEKHPDKAWDELVESLNG